MVKEGNGTGVKEANRYNPIRIPFSCQVGFMNLFFSQGKDAYSWNLNDECRSEHHPSLIGGISTELKKKIKQNKRSTPF